MDIKNGDEIEMEEGFCYIHDKGGFWLCILLDVDMKDIEAKHKKYLHFEFVNIEYFIFIFFQFKCI